MGFTEKGWHDDDGETISTRMQMKATRNNENFRRNESSMREITAIAHTCVANRMFSDRQAMILIINQTQRSHVAQIVYINLGGRAEPARRRPATLTTRTVLFSWIARGGGHVYPHLDETPGSQVPEKSLELF